MARKSVIEKSFDMLGKISPRYDIGSLEIAEIYEKTDNWYAAIAAGFRYGYVQGTKAEKAKWKKRAAVETTKNLTKPDLKNTYKEQIVKLLNDINNNWILEQILIFIKNMTKDACKGGNG